jgi:hypothetical protein
MIRSKILKDENDEETVEIYYDKMGKKTDLAQLFIIDGENYWIPISQIEDTDIENKTVYLTGWIAREKGLV